MAPEYHDMLMFTTLSHFEASVLFRRCLCTHKNPEILSPRQSFWFFGSEFEFKLRTILEYNDILGENIINRSPNN